MLQQISWTSFLLYFALLSTVWYIGLLLTVYRNDVFQRIAPNSNPNITLSAAVSVTEDTAELEKELMGASKLPEGLSIVSTSTLNFSSSDARGSVGQAKQEQLGLIPDVLQELKEIFEILGREDGNKNDFFALIAIVQEKYGRIGSHPNITQLNEFIREHAPFALTNEELENLWD